MQIEDPKHSTFTAKTLLSLSSLWIVESTDCGPLLSNHSPVETVSERPRENAYMMKVALLIAVITQDVYAFHACCHY